MGASPHTHSVLVVDDQDDVRNAFVVLLELTGCDVVAAGSGREALRILHEGFSPCLVLLDVCMPQMDGWTMWQQMQADAELAQTPVVMHSAERVDSERLRQAGIQDFLRKPIDSERVVASVD